MIIYRVEITLRPEIEGEWLHWMRKVHIPDVLRTGCFVECRTYKLMDAGATEPVYVMQYLCRSLKDYERYRDNFAPRLQKEHAELFAGRFRGSRQLLEEVWSAESTTAGPG